MVTSPIRAEAQDGNETRTSSLFLKTSRLLGIPQVRGVLLALGAIPLSLAAGVTSQVVAAALQSGFVFTELKSGNLAIGGGSKTGDFLFVIVLWGLLGLSYLLGTHRLGKSLASPPYQIVLFGQLSLSLIFLVPSVFSRIGAISGPSSPLYFIALAQLLGWAGYLVSRGLPDNEQKLVKEDRRTVSWREGAWFALFSLAWIPAAGILVFARWAGVISTTEPQTLQLFHAGLSAVVFAIGVTFRRLVHNRPVSTSLPGVIASAYALGALPLLLPPRLTVGAESAMLPGIDPAAWRLLLVSLGALIVLETAWRAYKYRHGGRHGAVFSSLALATLAVSFRTGGGIPAVSNDDYHFGEIFAPAYLFLDGGFENVGNMARGPMANLLPGLLNMVFFIGEASTLSYNLPLVALLSAAIGHLLLRPIIGLGPTTAIVSAFAVANHYLEGDFTALVLTFVAIALLGSPKSPAAKGVLATLLLGMAVFVYPLMGAAGTLLALGVSAATLVGSVLNKERAEIVDSAVRLGSFLATFVLAIVLDPTGQMRRFLTYVLAQAGSNAAAHGVPLDYTLRQQFDPGLFLTLSFGLVLVVSVVLLSRFRSYFTRPSGSSYYRLSLLAVPLIFVVGLSSRFLGRVEPGMLSFRPLAGSLVTLGLVLPLSLLLVRKSGLRRMASVAISAGVALSLVTSPVLHGGFQRSLFGALYQPATWASATLDERIPLLGLGTADPQHLAELEHLADVDDALEGLRIENLSQRNALNAYFGWPNAGDYMALYNIPNTVEEENEIEAIFEAAPEVLFIGPGTWWDGLSMTLRTPTIGQWVMGNYRPVQCENSYWAVTADSSGLSAAARFPEGCILGQTPAEMSAMWTQSVGAPSSLGFLPQTWSRNRVDMVVTGNVEVSADSSEPGVTKWSAVIDHGFVNESDFLRLTSQCKSGPASSPDRFNENPQESASAQLSWKDEGAEEWAASVSFNWGQGEFLVPLYAYPLWEASTGELLEMEFRADLGSCEGEWRILAEGLTPVSVDGAAR